MRGEFDAARQHYERAIVAAGETNLAARALGHELFGEFLLRMEERAAAARELALAVAVYEQRRAHAKARQLRERHSKLLGEEPGVALADFDVISTLKAAQVIAAEIERERLLPQLLRILLENAGAERGVLLEADGDRFVILAQRHVGDTTLEAVAARVASPQEVPLDLLSRVARTGEPLVSADATRDPSLMRAVRPEG